MEVPATEASHILMLQRLLAGAGCAHMHANGGGAAPGGAAPCFLEAVSHLGLRLKGEWLRFPLPPTAASPTAAAGLTEFGSPTTSCEHCNGFLFIGSLFAQDLRELEVRGCNCRVAVAWCTAWERPCVMNTVCSGLTGTGTTFPRRHRCLVSRPPDSASTISRLRALCPSSARFRRNLPSCEKSCTP